MFFLLLFLVALVHQDMIFVMILCHIRKYRFALKIHGSFYLVNDCLMCDQLLCLVLLFSNEYSVSRSMTNTDVHYDGKMNTFGRIIYIFNDSKRKVV